MDILLLPGQLVGISGLLLVVILIWAAAGMVRNALAALQIKNGRLLQDGDAVTVGDWHGKVVHLGWLRTTLLSDAGELVLVPNHHLVEQPVRLRRAAADGSLPSADSAATQGPRIDVPPPAADSVDPDSDLEQLQAAHARTLAEIAELAEAPAGVDPVSIRDRKTALIRRLARIETMIAARRSAGAPGAADEPS